MPSFDFKRPSFKRLALLAAAVTAVGALAACGPGQGSSSTTVVLTGPPDKVDALIARHKPLGPPAQALIEKLDDGQERASFHLSQGLPMGEVIALGKDAAKTGVNYSFSSGTNWGAERPALGDPPKASSTKTGERVV